MSTNLYSNDDVPFEGTILQELEESDGLPASSPVHAHKKRTDDPLEAFLRGLSEEADTDDQRARTQRQNEILSELEMQEPGTPHAELERSAANIAQAEEPIDYLDVINADYDPTVHGKPQNPQTKPSWLDEVLNNKTIKALRKTGDIVLGGISDTVHATLGALDQGLQAKQQMEQENLKELGAAGVDVGEQPEPEGSTVIGKIEQAIPEAPKSDDPVENIGRSLVQFASFFIPANWGLGAVGVSGRIAPYAAGVLEAFANRNPDDQTLSTFLLQTAPGLEQTELLGPALAFLKSDPDDSEAMRRFKFAIEDVVLGGAVDIGKNPKAAAQSVINMFDAVRQSKIGNIATDILSDQSGAVWFGRPKSGRAGFGAGGGSSAGTSGSAGPTGPTRNTVEEELGDLGRWFNDEVERFRRGDVRHIKDVANEARNLGLKSDDFIDAEPGTVLNDTMTAALGQLQDRKAQDILMAAESYLEDKSPEMAKVLVDSLKEFATMNPRAMGAGREAGRTMRILQETEIGRNALVRNIEQALGEAEAAKSTDVLARMITSLKDKDKARVFTNGLQKMQKSKTLGTLLEVYANALLSKPVTMVRNTLGSTVFLEAQVMERQIAGVLDLPINLLTGRPGTGVALGEAREMIHGQWVAKSKALQGMVHGFREDAAFSHRLGSSSSAVAKYERPRAISAETYGLDPQGMMGRMVNFAGRQVRIPSRAMAAQDQFNRVLAREAQLHALAFRKAREVSRAARQAGDPRRMAQKRAEEAYESIISNPPRHIVEEVEKFGNAATFTDQAGPATQALQKLVEAVPVLRFPLMFINTPSRIISQGFQRVPGIGLAMRESRQILKSGTRAEREMLAARQAVGLGIAGLVWGLAGGGRITGEGSRNPTLRQAEFQAKIPPRSIGVGSDDEGKPTAWIKYTDLVEPYTTTFAAMADLATGMPHALDEYSRGNTEPMELAGELINVLTGMIVNSASRKSYLTGINNIIDAMADEKGGKMGKVIGDIAAGFVPNIVKGVDAAADPEIKEAHGAWERFKRAVPYWNEGMKMKRDPITGEPVIRPRVFKLEDASDPLSGALTLAFELSNPVIPEQRGEDPEAEEVWENILRDKLTGIGLEMPDTYPSTRTVTDEQGRVIERPESKKYEDHEKDRLEVLRAGIRLDDRGQLSNSGLNLKESLLRTMRSPEYVTSTPGPDGGREYLVRYELERYKKAAMAVYAMENPDWAAQYKRSQLERKIHSTPGALAPENQQAIEGVRQEAERALSGGGSVPLIPR